MSWAGRDKEKYKLLEDSTKAKFFDYCDKVDNNRSMRDSGISTALTTMECNVQGLKFTHEFLQPLRQACASGIQVSESIVLIA